MDKATNAKIIQVTAGNIEQTGFFCYMSKRKSEGFRRKLAWFKARFAEGHVSLEGEPAARSPLPTVAPLTP